MNEVYYEILVSKKPSAGMKAARILALVLTIVGVLTTFIGALWAVVPTVALGVAAYFLKNFNSIEYEYLYIDKELQIDRILAQNSRKRMETLDVKELEILAPIRSHELDSYRKRNVKAKDYSSGAEENNSSKYMLVIQGKHIIFEPTEEMVKAIKVYSPRKVFTY